MAEQEGDEKFYGIPLEDLDESDIDDEDGDLVTVQHVTLNNKAALIRIKNDFRFKDKSLFDVLSVTSQEPVHVTDVFDDLSREQAFYEQALSAARFVQQRARQQENDEPFLPTEKDMEDAETLKDARHSNKAASAPKKSAKKAKADKEVQETEEMVDRIKLLKRKRKDAANAFTLDAAILDLDLENEEEEEAIKQMKKRTKSSPNSKLNRKLPSSRKLPMSAMSGKKKKKKVQRPGKARRLAKRNRG